LQIKIGRKLEIQYETATILVEMSNEKKVNKVWEKKCITSELPLKINRIK